MGMVRTELNGCGLSFDANVEESVAFDAFDLARESEDPSEETAIRLNIEGEGMTINRNIDRSTALEIIRLVWSNGHAVTWADALVDDLTGKQNAYLRVLLDADGWITNEEIRSRMADYGYDDLVPRSIAGIRQGLTRKTSEPLGERLDERDWLGSQNAYRIKDEYRAPLSQAMD